MKDTLRIFLLTLAVFAIGFGTGIWTQRRHHPMPPPPFGALEEFSPHRPPWGGREGKRFQMSEEKIAAIKAEMEKIRPEVEAFQTKLKAIDTDFRTKLEAMLTPEQRKLLPTLPEPGQRGFGHGPEGRGPGPFAGPLEGLAIFTIIKPALDHMSEELKLTAAQQVTLKTLLLERRQKFLDLVDAVPPPSLKLGRLMFPPPQ
ncbi:MAG: hypothetical protein B9S32_07885 [Verrucomicrobia bacterium Tous-C9LFEB]|nr:MAG: hypothetical protein B9S32_07885 [Verrucomicrobia bacterium Tous-C9LFEB]